MPSLVFIRRNWSPTGGAENYLYRLATQLEGQGWEISLLCESWDGGSGPFKEIKAMEVHGFRWQRPASFADAINSHLASQPYDCVFSMERGVKAHIYRAGDGIHREWLNRRYRENPLFGFFRNQLNPKNHTLLELERITFHPANSGHVIANSEMVREDILRHFDFPEERIHLIPNAVDIEKFSRGNRQAGREAMGWPEGRLICLLVGAGTIRKGHFYAQAAVERLGKAMELCIVDSPPPCSMPDLYAGADLLLLPTLYDPFANVTLEAMAAGLPVITTSDNGATMIIESGKNGFIIPHAWDLDEMTAYLTALCDPGLRQSIGTAARETASRQTMDTHLAATLKLIREAM